MTFYYDEDCMQCLAHEQSQLEYVMKLKVEDARRDYTVARVLYSTCLCDLELQ